MNNQSIDEGEFSSSKVLIFSAYSAISATGILFNVLFITCVAISSEKNRSVTRLMIANLALSDILMLSLSIFSPIAAVQTDWQFGEFLCKLTQSGSALSIFVSSFSATAIALHRYVTVVGPNLRKLRSTTAWFPITAIWILAAGLSTPLFIKSSVLESPAAQQANQSALMCVEHWEQTSDGTIYTLTCLVIQFLLPSLIIAVCYGRVSAVLYQRLRFHLARAYHRKQKRILAGIQRQRRTTRTLIFMVAMYILSWMPLNIFMLAMIFNFTGLIQWPYMEVTYIIMHCLAISSAAYNPIVYSWAHKEFRKQAYSDLVRCLPCLPSWNRHDKHKCPTTSEKRSLNTVTEEHCVTNVSKAFCDTTATYNRDHVIVATASNCEL